MPRLPSPEPPGEGEMISYRSIFVSDVHLGTPDCRADYLLDFLRSTRSDHLYLVGDIIDFEALAQRSYWPASHTAVLAQIAAIAARGTRVTYIPGNHDASLRGLHGQSVSGVAVQLRAEHLGADGRRYRGRRRRVRSRKQRTRLVTGSASTVIGGLLVQRTLNRARRSLGWPTCRVDVTKSRIALAMDFIAGFEQRVADDCADAGFDGHICGHIHFGNIRRIGGALYLNIGDWVEHCTALVEDEAGTMRLLHWSEHRSELALASFHHLPVGARMPLAFASLSPAQVAAARATSSLAA